MKIRIACRGPSPRPARTLLRICQYIFLMGGMGLLLFCAWSYAEGGIYQAYEDWKLGESLRPPSAVKPSRLAGILDFRRALLSSTGGSSIGRLEIPRLGISVMVLEGVQSHSLKLGAGHIPGTAFPGQPGNAGIAAHRDTFFRKLAEVRPQDEIVFKTLLGSYQYRVESTRVVGPADAGVLAPSQSPVLTLVTCYPFYYVGPAPDRFIVLARQTQAAEQ